MSVHGGNGSTFLPIDADNLAFEVGGTMRLRQALAPVPAPEVLPEHGEVQISASMLREITGRIWNGTDFV